MAKRKSIRELLVKTKPPIFLDADGHVLTLNIRHDEIYLVNQVYSIVLNSGGTAIWSTAQIDPHPEVWHDQRWLHGKDYKLINRGESLTGINSERVFGGAINIWLRTNGTSNVQMTLRGVPLTSYTKFDSGKSYAPPPQYYQPAADPGYENNPGHPYYSED